MTIKYNEIVICYLSIIFIMTNYRSWLVLATFDFMIFFLFYYFRGGDF